MNNYMKSNYIIVNSTASIAKYSIGSREYKTTYVEPTSHSNPVEEFWSEQHHNCT